MRTVLWTFLLFFLAVAVLLAFTAWGNADFRWYVGLLGLLALPAALVVGLTLGIRLYLRHAPLPDTAPTPISSWD